jgi:hypothetical protein
MSNNTPQPPKTSAPLGAIEPHVGLLTAPPSGQLIYKIMKVDDLLQSIRDGYLHFNRVDSYADFPGADADDGRQLPADQFANTSTGFLNAPQYSVSDYYNECRARTYACCFSLTNSDYIWQNYANGSKSGKVGLIFDLDQLRLSLNSIIDPAGARLLINGITCHQIFSINYGSIEYIEWSRHQANTIHLPNPIVYTYLKAMQFKEEQEIRISLSTIGIGQFQLNDGTSIKFPTSLRIPFDFRAAIENGTIRQILIAPDCNSSFLVSELANLNIAPGLGSDAAG